MPENLTRQILREHLADGELTPGDAISLAGSITLACNETSRWKNTVLAAQAFAQTRFSPSAMGASYRALYEHVAGAGKQD